MNGRRGLSLAQASGWLFADLLLMLVIVVLGGQVPDADGEPCEPTCPSSAAPSVPSSSAPATAQPSATSPPGLDPHSKSIVVEDVDVAGVLAGRPGALAHVQREVLRQRESRFAGRHAAMVMVWGSAADCPRCTTVNLSLSQRLADLIAPRVHAWDPEFFPDDDPKDGLKLIRPYHDGGGAPDTVRLELFFIRT